jgi:hypothetical protein
MEMIDSTGIPYLGGYLEERFGIKVGDEEMIPGNLGFITKIAGYIKGTNLAALYRRE